MVVLLLNIDVYDESWFILGKSSPFMAQQFRLVKYYNLQGLVNVPLNGAIGHHS